jgi:hypothetical protein
MRKIYVLRLSELTPREGCREKGLSSDSPRGLSLFYVHTGFRGTTAPKLNSQVLLRKGQQSPGNGLPSRVRSGWLLSPVNSCQSRGSNTAACRVEMPASRESWSLPQEIKSPNKVLLSANWNLPHSGGSLPQTFRLRCRSNPSA